MDIFDDSKGDVDDSGNDEAKLKVFILAADT